MGRALIAVLAASLCFCASALAVVGDFEHPASHDTSQQFTPATNVQRQDTPNDPGYDQAEPDTQQAVKSSNFYDEAFGLFGFASQRTPSAKYHDPGDGAKNGQQQTAGFNAAGAWKLTRGRPDVTIAILDTGIRWNDTALRTQIHLNTGELPLPQRADGTTDPGAPSGGYDLNRDGAVNVDDYANDPRVVAHPGRLITAEDLIHSFSDGTDADHNGYVDDIAGWDFFNNDNNPNDDSSYFAASNHGTGRAQGAAEQGNDGQGSIGVCPHCQIVPLRTWDTFVSDGDTFALGILYAADNGIPVIEGSNGSLYHSAFAEAASQYAYDKGSVQVFSGDDLNTGNHNYPANYSHTMLIQGVVPDTMGLGSNANEFGFGGFPAPTTFGGVPIGTAAPPTTFFRNANTTQYGGHSSISMEGTTGSENTGKAAGAVGLVISAARDNSVNLTPDETREILEQTAEDVLPGDTAGVGAADPAQTGWDEHFGWGRANLGAAVSVANGNDLPPQAMIGSPDWYAPLTGATAHLTGRAAVRYGGFHYRVEWGPGLAPTTWTTIKSGDSDVPVTDLGDLDLAQVRAALAAQTIPPDTGGPTFSAFSPNPYQQQFAVRLVVTQHGVATPGVDRRVFTALDDPTLRPGYPKRLGTGGEAPIRYADLNGDGVQELLVPLEDGTLHAYEPDGSELPGWPVHTDTLAQAADHLSAPGLAAVGAPLEPLRAPVVADLDSDGRPEVIASAGRHVYVWEADGTRRAGFPVSIQLSGTDTHLCTGPQSQPLVHRKCGFLASPSLGHLQGADKPLDIVIAGLDGHLYAWDPSGAALPHFPVDLVDPTETNKMYAESINSAAIGDLNGDGRDDVVIATNETYSASPQPTDITGGFEQGLADLLASAAGGSSRVYAVDGGTGSYLPGWPIKLNGVIQSTLPLIGPGHDAALARIGGAQRVIVSTTGGSLSEYDASGTRVLTAHQDARGAGSDVTDATPAQLNLFESAAVGDVLGTGTPDLVKYAVTTGQLANLALAGQNFPYNHTIGAFDGTTGAPLPAYPRVTDDYQFLSSSTIAKVDAASTANQILAGNGLGMLHAYDGLTGHDAPGFPKVTGGWLFAPAAQSDDARLADITREGYLFEWNTPAAAPCAGAAGRWPSFRHDDHGTGNLDADGTAPSAPGSMDLRGRRLTFVAPGDDGHCGTPTKYLAWADGTPVPITTPATATTRAPAGGSSVSIDVSLPGGTRTLAVAAADEAGNVGPAATVVVSGPGAGGGNSGGSGNGNPSGQPGSTGSGVPTRRAASCRDRVAPRSRHLGRVLVSRTGISLHGVASDRTRCAGLRGRVQRVRVALMRKVGKRCRPLLASGAFGPPRSCLRTVYLPARGTGTWSFSRHLALAPGRYELWSRAVDATGNRERKARGRNLVRLIVR